jgi:HAE1 family hydrophobic/amphiphilic exporter-1
VNISEIFIRKPIATSLLMAAILLVGMVAYRLLPVAALPAVDFPTIQVTAKYPGADPETMASSVATPLEYQFGQIAGVTQMTSTSALGFTQITLQFDLDRNIDGAAQDVQTAINEAAGFLPPMPTPPTYRKTNPADAPILVLALTSNTLPITVVDDYAENILAQKISQVSGVAIVGIGGQQKPAVRVQVDPAKLSALGLNLEDVRTVLGAANVDQPKGNFFGPARAVTIETDDQLFKATQYRNLIVAYRNGAPVRISDIANAIDGAEDTTLAGWFNRDRAIILSVQRQPGANVIETVDQIKSILPQLQAAIPPTIKVSVVSDRTTTIRAAVADVQFTLILTIGLVVMVIFLFLRKLWATVIPGVAVPLSIVGTFGVMYLFGYSLDNLSLMALSIAVGFVVDDAIVMIENIVRHIEEGLSPRDAALKGSREIGFTILSISISLIAVFIPLLLMGGIVGRLFREFAVTVSIAIAFSAFVSLTLTPTMCARFLKPKTVEKPGKLSAALERGFDALLALYDHGLKWVLRHQPFTLGVMIATVCATVVLFVLIPKGFFPQEDTGLILAVAEAGQDVSPEAMARYEENAIDVVLTDPAVLSIGGFIGAGGASATENDGRLVISLKPRDQRDATADQVINRLRPKLAKLQGVTVYMQSMQDITVGGRLSKTQYQYTLTDVGLSELNQWAPRVLEKLQSLPEITDVTSDEQNASAQVNLAIDRATASRLGILPQQIDDTLYDAFGQRHVSKIYTDLNQYYVILEVNPQMQKGPNALDNIYVKSSNGTEVPLSQIVHQTEGNALLSVNHQGQFPDVTISFNLKPGVALGDAVSAIDQATQAIGLPRSIQTSFQGSASAFESSLASEPMLIAAALIAVYIILGMLYESYIHPVTILSTLPSAGVGALLILMAVHLDLSVMGMVGIILLIGIVKKNGIMMIDFALDAERNRGLSPEQSIYEACKLRFRPILMTTMCALLGGVPLMLGSGTGSELRQPLGYTMVGGLIMSQLLTLFTTPVVYLYMERVGAWLGLQKKAPVRPEPVPAMPA